MFYDPYTKIFHVYCSKIFDAYYRKMFVAFYSKMLEDKELKDWVSCKHDCQYMVAIILRYVKTMNIYKVKLLHMKKI